jgi:hypothetical protein
MTKALIVGMGIGQLYQRVFAELKYDVETVDIKLKATYKSTDECVNAYNSLLSWYKQFMKTDKAKSMIADFDIHFPNQKITAIKKIDFIFWQTK